MLMINRFSIIAVTGLGGRPFASWQNNEGTMWLRDFLPQQVPGIRVYTYGYASALKGSPSRASIQDFTDGFTRAILSVRRTARVGIPTTISIGFSATR